MAFVLSTGPMSKIDTKAATKISSDDAKRARAIAKREGIKIGIVYRQAIEVGLATLEAQPSTGGKA